MINDHIQVGLAREGVFPEDLERDSSSSSFAAQGMAQAALSQQNWQQLRYWIKRLPEGEQQTQRWQYWWARAVMQTADSADALPDTTNSQDILSALASQRHYYGFMAALLLQQTPPLQPSLPEPESIDLKAIRIFDAPSNCLLWEKT